MPKKRVIKKVNKVNIVRENVTKEDKENIVKGDVVEALANAHFRVQIPIADKKEGGGDFKIVIAYLAGKMRLHRIRVIVGDSVELLMDPYGGKPRIVRRL